MSETIPSDLNELPDSRQFWGWWMITGGCLCGRIRFELQRAVGPFELCHCPRCRKVSGSAFMAGIGVRVEDFRFLSGEDQITVCTLPVRNRPPAYSVSFCRHCGSPAPAPPDSGWFEIAAGLLDDEPELRPDKHIYVDCASSWWEFADALPRYTAAEIAAHRQGQ